MAAGWSEPGLAEETDGIGRPIVSTETSNNDSIDEEPGNTSNGLGDSEEVIDARSDFAP